jgi:TonB family protein
MVYGMDKETMRIEWVGQVVDGKFTLLQWLGGSQRGGTFLTELSGPQSQKAAIKLMPAGAIGAEGHVAAWGVTATLAHPHLARLFHTGRCEVNTAPVLYAVTEYAEEDLAQILPERPLTPAETREMLGPVLDVISYLHERGLVHGHIKPSNVMVIDDQVKLSCDSLHILGGSGRHFPAPEAYEAPECGSGTISTATDIWSLGVILVEALTQHPADLDRSADGESIVPESIPQPFAGIVQECLRLDPQRRCTIGDIKARLEPARPVDTKAGKTGRIPPAKRRLTALVGAALVLLAAFAFVQLRSHKTEPSLQTEKPEPASADTASQPPTQVPGAESPKAAPVKGAVAERVLPELSEEAMQTIHGKFALSIKVEVDPNGNVSNAELDSPGPSRYFANLSLQAARKWKFKPARVDGQTAASAWILRFEFSQAAIEVTPDQVLP